MKYYVLLPSIHWVGSSLDNYQWESILRSVSAHRSTAGSMTPTTGDQHSRLSDPRRADAAFTRLLLSQHRRFTAQLDEAYGVEHPCTTTVARTFGTLKSGSIKSIFDAGLHEFLTGFIQDNYRLGDEIASTSGLLTPCG